MSEFDPYKSVAIDELPHNFLGIDPSLITGSAAKRRSMEDLRAGQYRLHDNFMVVNRIDYAQQQENPDAIRHINRGAALAQLLLEDSKPDFVDRSMDVFVDQVDLGSKSRTTRDPFTVAHQDLARNRRRMLDNDATEVHGVYTVQVDTVLARAGFGTSVEDAVRGLTGPGFEIPTLEPEARYGAALVALGVASFDLR